MAHVWVLLGEKGGDNAQALRLVQAVGAPFETKRLMVRPEFATVKPKVTASLDHLDLAASDELAPPWPDVVITVGRRMAAAALWVKQQLAGRCRIALIGAPKGEASAFDLVIAPVQYRTGSHPNVCRIGLPLLGVDPKRIEEARQSWKEGLAGLAQPLTVLLVGGSSGARSLEASTAMSWLKKVPRDGSLIVSTSRRTPDAVATALEAALAPGDRLYRWTSGDRENPYFGLLALGDRFIVTGDSISMLIEVARLGKPMAIAIDEETPSLLRRLGWPVAAPSRDFSVLHDYLLDGGWAVRLGEPFKSPPSPPPDDTAKAAAAVRALLSQ